MITGSMGLLPSASLNEQVEKELNVPDKSIAELLENQEDDTQDE